MTKIIKASEADFDSIWPIFQQIVEEGGTYVYSQDLTKDDAKSIWFDKNYDTYIAQNEDKIVGAYVIRPGHRDLGAHICNAAYIVTGEHSGKGIGRQMGEHSLEEAKKLGYSAMQFNYVIGTNAGAIHLWESLGFQIVGTIPDAYQNQSGTLTDIHIMHKKL